MDSVKKKIPKLRFPEFTDDWGKRKIFEITDRIVKPVKVSKSTEYKQIGIRSHGKGIFYKDHVLGEDLGNKRVFWIEPDLFIVNIVFAWEMAVAKTTANEIGMIASHRFPMYKPKQGILNLDFLLFFFLREKGRRVLELASPGGAGRNKTLGQQEFAKSTVLISNSFIEQQKIATFLTAVAKKIEHLTEKKTLLEQYKKGVMQQIFPSADGQAAQIRFKDQNGNDYPDWEERKLGNVCEIIKGTQLNSEHLTESGLYPCINGGVSESGYTDDFNRQENTITISEGGNSCGYVNFITTKFWSGGHCYTVANISSIIETQFLYQTLKYNQQRIMNLRVGSGLPNIQKKDLNKYKIEIPCIEEQKKIANFLNAIDAKIELVNTQINNTQQFKKGLLQQMFV